MSRRHLPPCQISLPKLYLHTKLEVSSFNRSGDRMGVPNLNRGSRDPSHAHFCWHFIFHRLVVAMTHPHTKLEVSSFNRSGDRRGLPYVTCKIDIAHAQYDVIKMLGVKTNINLAFSYPYFLFTMQLLENCRKK